MADAEQAARDLDNGGGGNYPPVERPAEPAQDVFAELRRESAPAAPAGGVAAPEAGKPAGSETTAPQSIEDALEALYSEPTLTLVDWDEAPAALPTDYVLRAPPDVLDTSEAGRAAMTRLREGLVEAGVGKTLASELFDHATRAQQGQEFPISWASGEAELRRDWGARYDAKLSAAKDMIKRAALRCPEIIPFLERTGMGNNPEFIKKVAYAAARRRR